MDNILSNQFFFLRKGKEPISWNIYDTTPRSEPELFWTNSDYCAKVLQTVEKKIAIKNLVFYITFDQINNLPSYGQNVVVIMTGDEGCNIPIYSYRVLAVFKPYGIRPFLGYNPFLNPSYINFLSLIQFLKAWVNRLPGLLYYWFTFLESKRLRQTKYNNIYTIPLGYYKQLEIPVKDLESRTYDLFFAGSIFNDTYPKNSLKYWITRWVQPPKTISRKQMIFNANALKQKRPDLNIELSTTSGFFSENNPDAKRYSEEIMNAKICLTPRGTSFETYRFFEAVRYGCIVLTEALPSRWFYDGSPAIKIKNWQYLEQILEELLDNKELMYKKHQETLMWWRNKCSPEATGQFIVEKLHTLINATA